MSYIHPVLGVLSALLLFWIGSLGLRARHRARYAPAARARHARIAPYIAAFVGITALLGTGSVWALRPDLELARSWHFWSGWSVATLLGIGAITSQHIHSDVGARAMHAWVGVAAMLGAILTALLGFKMLP